MRRALCLFISFFISLSFALPLSPQGFPLTTKEIPVAGGLIKLPAGIFTMGSPDPEKDRVSNEGPRREERPSSFSIGVYEVTFYGYDAYCAATGRAKPNDKGVRGNRPAASVSWYEAVDYCNWRSKEGGKYCRSAARDRFKPDGRNPILGFRVVRP